MGDDKLKHGLAAIAIGIGAFFLTEKVVESPTALSSLKLSKTGVLVLAVLVALTAVVGALYGKEVWDSMGHGFPDVWDAICGVLMFLCIGLPIILVYCYLKHRESVSGNA